MPAPHQKNKLHPQDQRNLLIFAVAFGIFYLVFDAYYLQPHMQKMDTYHQEVVQKKAEEDTGFRPPAFEPRPEVISRTKRSPLNHESLTGSINLQGGRIDDITLNNHFETIEKEEHIAIMSPEKTKFPRYVEFGWLDNNDNSSQMPNQQSEWRVKSKTDQTTTLMWDNGSGLVFERDISVVDDYLLEVKQRVINNTQQNKTLFPYTLITEHGLPTQLMNRWIIHEGAIGFIENLLEERDYYNMSQNKAEEIVSNSGWIGFTEQYWLTTILPEQNDPKTFRYAYKQADKEDPTSKSLYQVDVLGNSQQVAAGQTIEYTTHVFAGAKEFNALKAYEDKLGIKSLDAAIDWGWLWFLTKPFFTVLLMINGVIGYFAVTMLVFAFLLRLLIFPMANTSYRSFAKLKVITPRIVELKEMYKGDRAGLQKSMVDLYKKEKVNPAAGCLPIIIQIPIFFSLFKVLNIAIEMRHAPGFFWIDDLSSPDPTSLFNLFGLLPYDVPSLLMVGAWPCIMVLTLIVQRSMNPPPTDPIIRDMLRFMPYLMGYVMSGFAAGLVIYWTFTNILSAIQQYTIMRMMGVEVKLFQGWFGRGYQENDPDISKLGFSEEVIKSHLKKKNKKNGVEETSPETEVVEEIKEITPPKPKKKKKKK